jgi:hypothetical protein
MISGEEGAAKLVFFANYIVNQMLLSLSGAWIHKAKKITLQLFLNV